VDGLEVNFKGGQVGTADYFGLGCPPHPPMKKKTLGLIHTSATLHPGVRAVVKAKLPHVETFNIVVTVRARDRGARSLTADIARRVASYIASAESGGADFVLVYLFLDRARRRSSGAVCGVPVLRVDQPMADQAVKTGPRIGVIATLPTTLNPTAIS